VKTILKLLIVAAILNATARAAMTAWSYYQFKDAAQQTLIFGGNATPAQLQGLLLQRAAELNLPVEPQNVEVTREGPRTQAKASYTQRVELFPRYWYPFDFSFAVDALTMNPGTSPERAPRPR
jgi:hypothetical protein